MTTVPLRAQEPGEPIEVGRTYTAWLLEGNHDALWGRMSPELREVIGTAEGLGRIQAQLGAESELLNEIVTPVPGGHEYARLARFERLDGPVLIQWIFDSERTIVGSLVRPAPQPAPTEFLDYETRTPLRLPFGGEWFVFWGGRTVGENYHAASADQRFAYDFVVTREGTTHRGDGSRNEQYHCFGEPILAPGAGVVLIATDGVEDNRPGAMNAEQPAGNHVVIDHDNGEFSFLAHLKRGSVEVEPGGRVEAGDRIGLCGNSGHSSEPHLHYHLQNTGVFFEGAGLPAQFLGYRTGGASVGRGEPTRGQTIESLPEQ